MSTEMQTVQTDHINFKDIDKGYEPFAEALRSLGFDWQIARAEELKGFCQAHGGNALLFFQLPAVGQGQTGAEATERAVISNLWSGISESLAVIRQKQPGKLIMVRSMQLDGNRLTFSVS